VAKRKNAAIVLNDSQFKGQWKDRDAFASWLAQELDAAIGNRGAAMDDIRLAWAYYEQARMRAGNSPWPDAADLPSPYAPEYTDAVHARLMQTIFVEPMWTVEGWGASATKAPFVEEFHQRALEDERLQDFADEWVLRGLVEGVGTLEVSEAFEMRTERVRKRVQLARDAISGTPILDEKNEPVIERDPESGEPVELQEDPNTPPEMAPPSAEVEMDVAEPVRLGPDYDVIPYMDFFVLPAHARNKKQIWGYAKRFFRRVPELTARAKQGIYDPDGVKGIGTDNEHAGNTEQAPAGPVPVSQDGMTAQKELFEVQLLADLDGKGERWWRVTLSKERTKLLRLVHDDRTTRYIQWRPFPKPGTMDRGYSLIAHKLISVLEKDTADRNMAADHMAMLVGQPVQKVQGALWDEYEQPWGPKAVITVRQMGEVAPFQGITSQLGNLSQERQANRGDADRLIGQNDVAQGQISEEKRTLGEVQLVAGYAEVRTNVIVKRMQESLEELFQARHTIWKRTLANNPKLPIQRAMVIGRNAMGVDTTGLAQDAQISADMLEGIFWGKPRGSVETADLNRQRQDFNSFLATLPALAQMNPAIGMVLGTMPAAKSLLETAMKVNRVQDRQSILGSEAQNVFDTMQQQQEIQNDPRMQLLMAMAGGGGQPGMGGMPPQGEPAAPQQPPQPGVM
jgi:hypothetical protein